MGSAANELRRLLAEGYEREAWRALGFGSWTECVRGLSDEFGFSERYAWLQHSANETERLLNHGSVAQIPERHLRPLSRLDTDDDKREAWRVGRRSLGAVFVFVEPFQPDGAHLFAVFVHWRFFVAPIPDIAHRLHRLQSPFYLVNPLFVPFHFSPCPPPPFVWRSRSRW